MFPFRQERENSARLIVNERESRTTNTAFDVSLRLRRSAINQSATTASTAVEASTSDAAQRSTLSSWPPANRHRGTNHGGFWAYRSSASRLMPQGSRVRGCLSARVINSVEICSILSLAFSSSYLKASPPFLPVQWFTRIVKR